MGKFYPCISMDKKIIHTIEDSDLFYRELGYNNELALMGKLPDEFIWETYFRHDDRTGSICFQLNVIDYLLKHDKHFAEQYGSQAGDWIEAHAETMSGCRCPAQKRLTLCNARQSASLRA